ncbi:MAG TPA: ABC transporter substrate-binding protein [Candidatus Binatia bacterium]|jgi:ABC-type nitrate/sulfonate/bicarbonate transport system substrate-binding protein
MKHGRASYLSFFIIFFAFFAVTSLTIAAEEKRITIGFTTPTGTAALPYIMAERKGFFKKEGVNAVVVIMQNQVVVNGVLSRSLDYGATIANFTGAAKGGLPVRIVMATMEGLDHVLVTAPNIKRVEDLRGKTLGISSFGGAPHNELVMILRKYGLNPDKDVTFLQIGGGATRYISLESGSIQGTMLVSPLNKIAREKGFNELVYFNEILRVPLSGLAVHVDKIKESPEEIIKVIKALLTSIEFIRTNKAEILAFLDMNWGVKNPAVREGFYNDMLSLYCRTGIVSDDTINNIVRFTQATRKTQENISVSEITDWSFAKKANEELKR